MDNLTPQQRRGAAIYAARLHGGVAPDEALSSEAVTQTPELEAVEAETALEAAYEPVTEPARRRGYGVAWWVSMTVVGAAVGVVIVGGIKFIDGPVEAAGPGPKLTQLKAMPSVAPTANELSGLYVSMSYPGVFDQTAQVKNNQHALEQYVLSSKSDYSRQITVEVRPLLPGGLHEDSSYRFRQMNTADYKERTDVLGNGEKVQVMVKTDRSEVTLFWPHGPNEVTVSVTTNNPRDDLEAFIKLVESKLRWRK